MHESLVSLCVQSGVPSSCILNRNNYLFHPFHDFSSIFKSFLANYSHSGRQQLILRERENWENKDLHPGLVFQQLPARTEHQSDQNIFNMLETKMIRDHIQFKKGHYEGICINSHVLITFFLAFHEQIVTWHLSCASFQFLFPLC